MMTDEKERDGVVVEKLMKIMVWLAKRKQMKAKKIFQAAKKEAEKLLPAAWIRRRFHEIVRSEAEEEWKMRKEKNKKKKDHLEKRYKPRKEMGMFRDIPVGDSELGDDRDEGQENILALGVIVTPDEEEYLKLPNTMTDFAPVDVEKVKTGIQSTAAILRMSVRENGDNSSQGIDPQEQEAVMATRRVYDSDLREADFRKRRVTDSSLNKRTTVPLPVGPDMEVKIMGLVNSLEQLADKAGKEQEACLKDGRRAQSTLSEQAKRGRKSLLAREKAGELVIVSTDKSGKRAVMNKELYIQCMQPHIEGDSVHTREEVDLVEKRFNGASAQILKAFGWGEDWKHEARLKSAHTASYNSVPSMNQTLKDHKPSPNIATRPICRPLG